MPHLERCENPTAYEIRVQGILDASWSDWFNDFGLAVEGEKTVLRGTAPDQSALLAILIKLNDMGMMILTVKRLADALEVTDR